MQSADGKPHTVMDMGEVTGHIQRLTTKKNRLIQESESTVASLRSKIIQVESGAARQVELLDADIADLNKRRAELKAKGVSRE